MRRQLPLLARILISFTLAWVVGFCVLLGSTIYAFLNPKLSVDIANVGWIGIGGGPCLDGQMSIYYDPHGKELEENISMYRGPAPIYALVIGDHPDLFPQVAVQPTEANPCDRSYQIPPELPPDALIEGGTAVYPLAISASVPDGSVRKGESVLVNVTLELLEEFDGSGAVTAYTWRPGEERLLRMYIQAPNFETSIVDSSRFIDAPEPGKPVHIQWVLAPKEGAQGSQQVMVEILEDGPDRMIPVGDAVLQLRVNDVFNFDPIILTVFSSFGVGLASFLATTKIALELYEMIQKKKPSRSKRKH